MFLHQTIKFPKLFACLRLGLYEPLESVPNVDAVIISTTKVGDLAVRQVRALLSLIVPPGRTSERRVCAASQVLPLGDLGSFASIFGRELARP